MDLLADVVLLLHAAIVAFVVGGLVLVLVGNRLGWGWVDHPLFRAAHLGTIGIVVAESWLGIACPLTTLESWLRVQAGAPAQAGSFIGRWVQRLLFYDAPEAVFIALYSAFGALVAATWWRYPPAWRRRAPSAGGTPLALAGSMNPALCDPDPATEGDRPPGAGGPGAAVTAPPPARWNAAAVARAPLVIVVNAGSGAGDTDEACREIAQVLQDAGRAHQLLRVDRPQRLPEIAARAVAEAQRAGGIVVAAGGDGTLNAVAQAALGSGCPFGVIAQGTFNYFARAHGLPTTTREATAALLTAQPQAVQVGLVNERVFLVNASLGLYPRSLEDREAMKQRYGRHRLVALGAALRTLARGFRPMRVRLQHGDGTEALKLATLFVGNNRLQLEQMGLAEAAAVDAGRLAVVLVRPLPKRSLLWLLVRGAFGALSDARGVRHLAVPDLQVAPTTWPRRRWRVSTDGELQWMVAPLRFRVAPQPLWLMRPLDPDVDAV
jgi:diacylglycerol kinase family enzyme